MYKIVNVSRDSRYKGRRVGTPGRASRTKTFRFAGRRLVPTKYMLVQDELVEANRAKLAVAEKTGLIKVIHLPRGVVEDVLEAEEAPAVVELVEELPVLDGVELFEETPVVEEEDSEEAPEESCESSSEGGDEGAFDGRPLIPGETELREMSVGELKALAKELGVLGKAKSKASIVNKLNEARS